jgi:hypothetical protein
MVPQSWNPSAKTSSPSTELLSLHSALQALAAKTLKNKIVVAPPNHKENQLYKLQSKHFSFKVGLGALLVIAVGPSGREPRTPAPEPRTPIRNPRTPAPKHRTPAPEPRTPTPEPRAQHANHEAQHIDHEAQRLRQRNHTHFASMRSALTSHPSSGVVALGGGRPILRIIACKFGPIQDTCRTHRCILH